jgi:hypothetical protein
LAFREIKLFHGFHLPTEFELLAVYTKSPLLARGYAHWLVTLFPVKMPNISHKKWHQLEKDWAMVGSYILQMFDMFAHQD